MKKLGHACSDTAVVTFDNVRVPAKNVIGELNVGFTYQMIQFQEERLVIGKKSKCFVLVVRKNSLM